MYTVEKDFFDNIGRPVRFIHHPKTSLFKEPNTPKVIRGFVIDWNVLNDWVKIQTVNGVVHVYMDDIVDTSLVWEG